MTNRNNSSEKPCIYIVDDDATMRLLMTDALEDDDYVLMEFSNGMDVLEAIRNHQPDMVLLDVKMPKMDGFEVCTKIRDNYGDINTSVVMVTGLEDSDSIEKAFKVGATAFINKPINRITFPHDIRYLLKARNAFVDLKQREMHLEHMDTISRIITQQKDRNSVLQESMHALLEILRADHAVIISSTDSKNNNLDIICEATREESQSNISSKLNTLAQLDESILYRARNSEYPLLVENKRDSDSAINAALGFHSKMIKHLLSEDNKSWFLVVQNCSGDEPWSALDRETFYRISVRLGSVLSQHLLMEQLHRSEHLLRQAQHIGHLGNWSWNVNTGQLTWSEEMFRIYGFDPGSFTPVYGDFYKVIFEEDYARVRIFEQTSFESGETYNIEHRIRLPNGETRWVHEQAVGLVDENGRLTEVHGTVQDITERLKKQEQELHDHKMDAIGQLTSGIAHDFGNLMTIARGNLDLLTEALPGQCSIGSEYIEILDDANSAIQDGVELTKQLLAFSRKQSTSPEIISVSDTINKFSKLIANTLGDNITKSIELQDNIPDILVDPALFTSSLINIIINARDAMPDGGQLSITANTHSSYESDSINLLNTPVSGTYLCINIEDTGIGMSDYIRQHAVEPFFTTKNEGTGLGLSMAYGFMKQSGGQLIIDSREGKGTCVKMLFPVHAGEHISQPEDILQNTQPFHDTSILVVEDNPAVRQLVVRCLDRLGLELFEAEDATKAQEILDNHADIDLLFTDIIMPGEINGRELADWASEKYPDLKIILTTAAKNEAIRLLQASEHPFHLLLKPFSKQELVKTVIKIFQDDFENNQAVS